MKTENNQFLPTKVNVKLSIDEETVRKNITENINQMDKWLDRLFYVNGQEAVIISAGPSLEKYVKQFNIKERMEHPHRNFKVFCVKHALPRLMDMGIEPDYCVILDGRDFEGESTHGKSRKGLFKKIPKRTIFLVASMSHPGYAKYLKEKGAKVVGWHTEVTGIRDFPIKAPIISGGTSSGTRAIAIAHSLGMRKVTLIAFDSCIHNPTEADLNKKDDKGRPKYIPVNLQVSRPVITPELADLLGKVGEEYEKLGFNYGNQISKRFYTTGELMAQAQDFEQFFSAKNFDIEYAVYDDGMVSHMFSNMQNKFIRDHDPDLFFKGLLKDYPDDIKKVLDKSPKTKTK